MQVSESARLDAIHRLAIVALESGLLSQIRNTLEAIRWYSDDENYRPDCALDGKPLDAAHDRLTFAEHLAQNPFARRVQNAPAAVCCSQCGFRYPDRGQRACDTCGGELVECRHAESVHEGEF